MSNTKQTKEDTKENKKKKEFGFVRKNLDANTELLDGHLGVDTSYDMIKLELKFAGKDAVMYMIDGFAKDDIMNKILYHLSQLEREELVPNTLEKLMKKHLNYIEVESIDTIDKCIPFILAGAVVLFVDGIDKAIVIDARTYPARGPDEPDLEKVVRGSRDGFVETLVFNTALIRRRVRDPNLRMEIMQVGERSISDIVVCYIEDIANPDLVEEIKDRINSIRIDGLPMAEKSVEELITEGSSFNPFPRVRYTERPDVAATHLFEGHVLVVVDTSPSVIIAPSTLWHHMQHAEEYRQTPAVGMWIRWVRFAAIFASVFVLPLWLLISLQPELLPESLKFLGPEKVGEIPLLGQFIIAEIGLDMIRLAAIHTPSALATALGLIAVFLLGDLAISVGLFAPEVILYLAIAGIGTFTTPSYELGFALRLVRFALLIATGLFLLPGFIVASLFIFVTLLRMKSFKLPYLWPLIPFNWTALKTILVRSPVPIQNTRPSGLRPLDKRRQPANRTVFNHAKKPLTEQKDKEQKDEENKK